MFPSLSAGKAPYPKEGGRSATWLTGWSNPPLTNQTSADGLPGLTSQVLTTEINSVLEPGIEPRTTNLKPSALTITPSCPAIQINIFMPLLKES